MKTEDESVVRAVVDALYTAYLAGDTTAMLATMADDVAVRFLGRTAIRGIDDARQFFAVNNASLQDLDFRIRNKIIAREWAAVVWEETAMALGSSYENHGVDVFRVVDGKIVVLHVNNDVVTRRRAFAPGSPDTARH